jgi:Fe-Mn family superoxide dismutase
MDFTLPPLPYAVDALEPHVSSQTLRLHHETHEREYLAKLEVLIGKKPEAELSLESFLRNAEGKALEIAAQIWNHEFYWRSMRPDGGGQPADPLAAAITASLGSFARLRETFIALGSAHFGSGWIWLVRAGARVRVVTTSNADSPLLHGEVPLVTADLWEHSYYLDHHHDRKRYLGAFIDRLVDWEFACANFRA